MDGLSGTIGALTVSADAKFVASDFPDMGARVDENATGDPRVDAEANLHDDEDSDTDDEGGQEGDD